jgi:hypothetical protein
MTGKTMLTISSIEGKVSCHHFLKEYKRIIERNGWEVKHWSN